MEWKEKRADDALQQYADGFRKERVGIRLHIAPQGTEAVRRRVMRVAGYAVAAAVILGVFILVGESETVYGYVNDVPLTSKEEAREQARKMFEDLAVGMSPAEEVLGSLFSL